MCIRDSKKDEYVLKNLNFNIESGKMLALVGSTGAGKTSIISVLNRFYEIDSGTISIDNINIILHPTQCIYV